MTRISGAHISKAFLASLILTFRNIVLLMNFFLFEKWICAIFYLSGIIIFRFWASWSIICFVVWESVITLSITASTTLAPSSAIRSLMRFAWFSGVFLRMRVIGFVRRFWILIPVGLVWLCIPASWFLIRILIRLTARASKWFDLNLMI